MLHRTIISFVLAACPLLGCNGSTVAIDMTSSPLVAAPEDALFEHVYVSLAAVDVHVVDKEVKADGDPLDVSIDTSQKWYTLNLRGGKFDLISLQNDATAALGEVGVPDGKITQIRLFINEAGENEVVLKDTRHCQLDVSGVNGTGIKINHPFKAIDLPAGEKVRVVIDFDLEESVEHIGDCTYTLNPVIKLKKAEVTDDALR